jgi:hypothetical protein
MQTRVEKISLRASILALGFAVASAHLASAQAMSPTLTKAFGASAFALGGTDTLTFDLNNPNAGSPLTGLAFTDTLPAGLLIATPNGLNGSCGGGTITATAGTSLISLTGASLPALSSCTLSVNITATALGPTTNTTSTVTSNESNPGAAATADVFVGASVPMLGLRGLLALGLVLAAVGALLLKRV